MSNLRVQGNVSGSGTITLVTPNTNSTYEVLLPAAGGSIAVGPQGSTGQIQYNSSGVFAGNVNLTFDGSVLYVSGSQRLRAAATGSTANGFQLDAGAQAHYWYLADNTNSVYEIGSTAGAWRWQNSLGERLRINSNGALVLAGGATAADGVGIAFPATQSASSNANTLDDYEEGTFTPVVKGTSTAGTVTYVVQIGRYTKIGNRVFFQISVAWNSGTGTGNLRVDGLPFTNASGTGFNPPPTIVTQHIVLTANHYAIGDVPQGQSRVDIYSCPTGGGAIADVAYDAAGEIMCAGHYFVT